MFTPSDYLGYQPPQRADTYTNLIEVGAPFEHEGVRYCYIFYDTWEEMPSWCAMIVIL